ncbi:MAG: adenine deaminase [Solirubrobacterales bacterium]
MPPLPTPSAPADPLAARARLAAVARGDVPADVVLRGGTVVNVASCELERADVAIADGLIAGLGPYDGEKILEVDGTFLTPAFIEGHLHVESSLLTPPGFAALVAPRGTGTVVADPHEIANVCGADGVRWMRDASRGLPVDIRYGASPCVPASDLGTAGATLGVDDLLALDDEQPFAGLAEVMSFPLVVAAEPDVTAKLDAFAGRVIDGHAPGLGGLGLNAYVGAGPASDHECTTAAEAREKLRRGMRIMIREGSTARNLDALIGLVTPANSRRFMFVTDDCHAADLSDRGHLDHQLRRALEHGLDPLVALQMVTINVAEHFRLHDRGMLAPGRRADIVVLEDLVGFRARTVLHGGHTVASGGRLTERVRSDAGPPPDSGVRIDPDPAALRVEAGSGALRVVGTTEGQIVTELRELEARIEDGTAVADPERDVAKICVFERHHGSGRVGVGFVQGLGLARGAIASTVAHDCHNLVVAGTSDNEITHAAQVVTDLGGGQAAVRDGETLAALALPVAGLMSQADPGVVADAHRELHRAAGRLGSEVADPFMLLSFCALEVIPAFKVTDRGPVDVGSFSVIDLFAG